LNFCSVARRTWTATTTGTAPSTARFPDATAKVPQAGKSLPGHQVKSHLNLHADDDHHHQAGAAETKETHT